MYKIFVNNCIIYLSFDLNKKLINSNIEIYDCLNNNDFVKLIKKYQFTEREIIINFCSKKSLKKISLQYFDLIKASGGLVENNKNQILLIKRFGFWDLPKGKREDNENSGQCAIREIFEECGIQSELIDHLACTYHTYNINKSHKLKETNWYYMKYDGDEKLVPQTEEGIEKVKWVNKEKLSKYIKNSYPSIKVVFKNYNKLIK